MYNTLIIYFVFSFLVLFVCASVSYKLNLVDIPNKRKIHDKPVAFTGGLSISIIYISSIHFFDVYGKELNLILSISFLIAILGFIDDKFNLNAGSKLSLQIIPIFYLIVFESMALTNIGDYDVFRLDLGTFSIPFTLLCILFLINSFNYFDGIDGLLSSISISIIVILYFLVHDDNVKLFLLTIFVPITTFLIFNFSLFKLPKLFLGDGGSLLLGFIIAFILIYLANQKIVHPILLAWSIQIFVYEFISINLIRLKNKKGIFNAGNDHLHHYLIKKTNSKLITNFILISTNVVLFLIGYVAFEFINALTSLILFLFFFIIFLILRIKYSDF
tara:strand:+ start:43 stop:1035 length:993 start_codon:yes stop_codon:yes gene_type:complete